MSDSLIGDQQQLADRQSIVNEAGLVYDVPDRLEPGPGCRRKQERCSSQDEHGSCHNGGDDGHPVVILAWIMNRGDE